MPEIHARWKGEAQLYGCPREKSYPHSFTDNQRYKNDEGNITYRPKSHTGVDEREEEQTNVHKELQLTLKQFQGAVAIMGAGDSLGNNFGIVFH